MCVCVLSTDHDHDPSHPAHHVSLHDHRACVSVSFMFLVSVQLCAYYLPLTQILGGSTLRSPEYSCTENAWMPQSRSTPQFSSSAPIFIPLTCCFSSPTHNTHTHTPLTHHYSPTHTRSTVATLRLRFITAFTLKTVKRYFMKT